MQEDGEKDLRWEDEEQKVISEAFIAHYATGDVAALSQLVKKTLPLADLFKNSITIACHWIVWNDMRKRRQHWQA